MTEKYASKELQTWEDVVLHRDRDFVEAYGKGNKADLKKYWDVMTKPKPFLPGDEFGC